MEKLKSILPWELKKMIEQSTPNDLPSTCSSLHDFFSQSPLFHSMIEDLTNTQLGFCAKNKESALELKSKGNACFSAQDYSQALHFYSQALRASPVDAVDKENKLVATLYVNRASSLHKLNLLEESLRDCNRALSISPRYAKAWYRRGKVNTSLLYNEDAICDLKIAMNMEGSSSAKRQIDSDLKLIANQNNTGNSVGKFGRKKPLLNEDEVREAKLQCVSTPTKGRGMASLSDIPPASLIHKEEPYAAIISKNCRETHCHFCFNELPADTVPCTSCSMPSYCSEHCRLQAGGQMSRNCLTNNGADDILLSELQRCFSEVTLESESKSGVECFFEHRHECHGVNWPVVLPSEVVLAGRILVKLLESNEPCYSIKDLSHNYLQLPPESKLELHVYSIVLLYCLHYSYGSKLELNGASIEKVIIVLSQIKVNSMAIVRMKYLDMFDKLHQPENLSLLGDAITRNLEQVRVGQAVYLSGSLFNHSCMPNIHAYFISRTLLIRATESVPTGCPLELSYGPQVGQWDCRRRQQFLQDNYSFECQCSGCTRVNLPDLVLNAFRCSKPDCFGLVLDRSTDKYMRHKIEHLQETHKVRNMEQQSEFDKMINGEIGNMAYLMFRKSNHSHEIQFGCCLKCGSAYDLKSLLATVDEAELCIQSLQEACVSDKVHSDPFSKALSSLEVLKLSLHPYNKKLAEAQDILAEAFCSVTEMQQAMGHCTASVEILKKIYGPGHIAVGNELVKLSSLQLAVADTATADTVNQMETIFSNYYGRHAEVLFPYLQHLKGEVGKLVDEGRHGV